MGAKGYSRQQMADAVALAAIVGAEAAADELGMTERTVRKWCERAGRTPADAIETDDWKSIGARAMARARRLLEDGKVNATQALTMAAIADRNAAKVQEAPPDSAVTAHEAFDDWLLSDDVIGSLGLTLTEESEEEDGRAVNSVQRELMRRANEEHGQPHRPATLAWFSGRPEFPAGDILEWAQAQTVAMLAEHGSLPAIRDWERAQQEASRQAVTDQLALNRAMREAMQRAALDAETQALLDEAERWLAAQATP